MIGHEASSTHREMCLSLNVTSHKPRRPSVREE